MYDEMIQSTFIRMIVSTLMYCSFFLSFFLTSKSSANVRHLQIVGILLICQWTGWVFENCDTLETKGTSYYQNSYSANA